MLYMVLHYILKLPIHAYKHKNSPLFLHVHFHSFSNSLHQNLGIDAETPEMNILSIYSMLLYIKYISPALILSVIYIAIHFTLQSTETYLLFTFDTQKLTRIYHLYTYSLLHSSHTHLFLNIAGHIPIGTVLHSDMSCMRLFLIHTSSVIHGAWGIIWQYFLSNNAIFLKNPGIINVGSSAGFYGLYGAILPTLLHDWQLIHIWKRVFYTGMLVIIVIGETVSYVLLYNPQISYSSHLAGAIAGALTGTSLITVKSTQSVWRSRVKYSALCALMLLTGAGIVSVSGWMG